MTQDDTYSLLIPSYLRGELSAAEAADFEAYLSENPDFQTEIDFQRNLMAARPEQDDTGLEFGWARLSRSIDELEVEAEEPKSSERAAKNILPFPAMWKTAALVLACVSLGQAYYISSAQPDGQYELASELQPSGATLQLSFSPRASVNDVSDFLTANESQIIAGPSKLGIYTLSFSDNKRCLSLISELNSEDSLVDSYTSCSTNP